MDSTGVDAGHMPISSGILLLFIVILGLLFYFLPAIIAARRKHPQLKSIELLNIFLGWTFLGWIAALAWSCSSGSAETQQSITESNADELSKLWDLKEKGALTEGEYQKRKKKLLS